MVVRDIRNVILWQRPSDKKCPKCGGIMLIKGNKLVCANEECGYILDTAKNDN